MSLLGTGQSASDSASVSLLGIITAQVSDHAGFLHEVNCLLDTGCQKDLISLATASKLGLNISEEKTHSINGLGCATQSSVGEATLSIQSRFNPSAKISLTASVLTVIANDIGATKVIPDFASKLKNHKLADVNPFGRKSVGIVLSCTSSLSILRLGHSSAVQPSDWALNLIPTCFGEILWGRVPVTSDISQSCSLFI